MTDDQAELIIRLCTQAGMVMEDTVGPALTIRRGDASDVTGRLAELAHAAERITAIVRTAQALAVL